MNVEQLSEKIAALYFFIFPLFFLQLTFSFQFIQYRPLSCVLIYMKKIEIIELPKIYDPRGSLTVKFKSNNCYGAEKVHRITEALSAPTSTFSPASTSSPASVPFVRSQYEIEAFGDSRGDKEMLAFADKGHYKPFR